LILAVPRSYDPYLYEEDLGEGRLILRVEGVGEVSMKGFSARVKVLGWGLSRNLRKECIFDGLWGGGCAI
jgi:hypothetical protein